MLVTRPTLFLNSSIARANIARMKHKADALGLKLRPHFKTHQSIEIGAMFKAHGCDRIAVSSLGMASYFSEEWSDITVAFPANIQEIDLINTLSEKIKLNLTVYNLDTLHFLEQHLDHQVYVYLKINIGNNRAGFPVDADAEILEFCRLARSCKHLHLEGVLMHAGHSYKCRGKESILEVHQACMSRVSTLKELLKAEFPSLIFSYGDTPTNSVADSFPGVDELRPGNFVFYDLTQAAIGSCTENDIAVALACPVVGKQSDGQTIILYGGGVHLSKDVLLRRDGVRTYGRPVSLRDSDWSLMSSESYLSGISQEHGVLKVSSAEFDEIKIGDCIGILPVHSCMTADLMKEYTDLEHMNKIKMCQMKNPC